VLNFTSKPLIVIAFLQRGAHPGKLPRKSRASRRRGASTGRHLPIADRQKAPYAADGGGEAQDETINLSTA
jgi:hypothetical protein